VVHVRPDEEAVRRALKRFEEGYAAYDQPRFTSASNTAWIIRTAQSPPSPSSPT